MPTHITLRMQIGLNQNAEDAGHRIVDLIRTTGADELMFFYFGEELNDGHEPIERVRQWIEHSRVYRKMAAAEGVQISLNPWHTLLHCERGRRLKPGQNWRTLVAPDGQTSPVCVCPLDPRWRDYFDATLRLYAAEDFRVIWIDDDIRLHNHTPLAWSCFCPLHVAEFNRRTGQNATREQIVEHCTAPGEPHPWRERWLDMWDDTQLELIDHWRQIVEARGVRLGLMTSCLENHAAEGRRWEKWWRAMTGDTNKPPVVRPYFWGYNDMPNQAFCQALAFLDEARVSQPPNADNGPEVECYTYGRWNKSFRQIHAQMSAGLMQGATHLNVSLFDFMGNHPDDEPQRAVFLKRSRPTLDWLAETFPMSLRSVGVGCPFSQDVSRRVHAEKSGDWPALVCPFDGWFSWLGAAGQAFSRRASEHVNALHGPATWAYSDEELRQWLSRGVLLDAIAAHILIERGFEPLIGLKNGRFVTQAQMRYSFEHCIDERFAIRKGAAVTLNHNARLFQGEPLPAARVVSEVHSPTHETLGHGLVVFENELGGRVATTPWEAHHGTGLMIVQRAVQLAKLLDWLDPQSTRGCVEGQAWVVPQFMTDGKTWRGVVWNVNPDAVAEPMRVRLPRDMPAPRSVTQVDALSNRFNAAYRDGLLTPARPMHQWEYIVLA